MDYSIQVASQRSLQYSRLCESPTWHLMYMHSLTGFYFLQAWSGSQNLVTFRNFTRQLSYVKKLWLQLNRLSLTWGPFNRSSYLLVDCFLIFGYSLLMKKFHNICQAHVFYPEKGGCAAFLANYDTKSGARVMFNNRHYSLPPWSISILPDCRNVVFNTAKVRLPWAPPPIVLEAFKFAAELIF